VLARLQAFRSSSTVTCCGYKLANDGQDTRAIQHYLGHRAIASTVRDTALAPDRFTGF
jgi:type 1 fimbriae regulatory protein FimE